MNGAGPPGQKNESAPAKKRSRELNGISSLAIYIGVSTATVFSRNAAREMDTATRAKGRWHLNRHINWARRLKLSGSRKNVLFVLADHANAQDEVWLKLDTICNESGHCRDTVIAALDELEQLQRIQDTGKRKGKTQSIKVYRLSSAEIPTTKQSEKSEVSSRSFRVKQSEFSGEAVGKDRLLAVGKIGLLHEAKEPENQTPNPQGSHNEPTKRIECANNGLPEHIANILKTPDDRLVFDGSDWLGSLEKALGPREWKQCGAMWRMRARSGEESAKALRNATEDFFTLTPAERSKIRNRAAWITDRYERGFEKTGKCRAVTRQAQTEPEPLPFLPSKVTAVTTSRDRGRESQSSVKKPQGLGDYKTDDEALAFVRENGFPNATILPEDQP